MPIVRTYQCDECGTKFDKLHFDRSEPAPPCPGCAALSAKQTQVPAGFAILGTKSKAMDITQDIMENDMGMSNFKDNMREGDIAAITPPNIAPKVDNFFSGGGSVLKVPGGNSNIMNLAKQGVAAQNAESRNPIQMLHRANKAKGPSAAKVLCRPVNLVR